MYLYHSISTQCIIQKLPLLYSNHKPADEIFDLSSRWIKKEKKNSFIVLFTTNDEEVDSYNDSIHNVEQTAQNYKKKKTYTQIIFKDGNS